MAETIIPKTIPFIIGEEALVTKVWAGPFTGLYRGQNILQGSQVQIPPQEAVSGWFR